MRFLLFLKIYYRAPESIYSTCAYTTPTATISDRVSLLRTRFLLRDPVQDGVWRKRAPDQRPELQWHRIHFVLVKLWNCIVSLHSGSKGPVVSRTIVI